MPGVYGPTLPALAVLVKRPGPGALASTFVVRGACYGAGTLLAGLLVERVTDGALLLWVGAALGMCACGAALPYSASLSSLTLLVGGLNLAAGAVDVIGNVLIVDLWREDDRRGATGMNMLHAAWSAGAALAPSLATAIGLDPASLPRVYGTAAALSAVSGVAPLVLGRRPRGKGAAASPLAAADEARGVSDVGGPPTDSAGVGWVCQSAPPPPARVAVVLGSMVLFYVCLGAAERVPGDWLTSVVARSGLAGEEEGAVATSFFFGAHLAGRVVAVPLSWLVPPSRMLTGAFAIACTSALGLLVLGQHDYAWLCACFAGIGLGIAALYPYGILLAKQRVPLSSVWISRLAAAALIGDVAFPPLVGALLPTAPRTLYWAEASVVFLQTLCFLLVALLPQHPPPGVAPEIALGAVAAVPGGPVAPADGVVIVHLRDLRAIHSPRMPGKNAAKAS
jgi:fucose permease